MWLGVRREAPIDATATAPRAKSDALPYLGRITRAKARALQEDLKAGLLTYGAPRESPSEAWCLLVAIDPAAPAL